MTETPRGGERLAPESLLDQLGWLHGLARSLVGEDRADDATQDALLAALKSPPDASTVGGRRRWLARVLQNRIVSQFRSERRRRRRESEVARPERAPSDPDLLERAELQSSLVQAVVALREPYRTVLLLRYFEGANAVEIARRQGVSSATARSQIKRGLDLLRESLDRRHDGRAGWTPGMLALVALPPKHVAAATAATTAAATATAHTAAGTVMAGLATGGWIMSVKSFAASVVLGAALIGGALFWMNREHPLPVVTDRAGGEAPAATAEPSGDLGGADATVGVASLSTTAAVDEAPTTEAAPVGWIEGVVTDAGGQPIEGIVVHAVSPGGSQITRESFEGGQRIALSINGSMFGDSVSLAEPPEIDDPHQRGVTDAAGRYRIADLEPGNYGVVARGEGYRQAWHPRLEVVADRAAVRDFGLDVGSTIVGFVRDAAGRPVAGARVSAKTGTLGLPTGEAGLILLDPVAERPDQGRIAATSDANGRFELEGLASGNYSLIARHADYGPGVVGRIAAGSNGVEVTMTTGVTIAGTVFDADGAPVPGVSVRVRGSGVGDLGALAGGQTETDAAGRYRFEHLYPVRMRMTVESQAHPRMRSELIQPKDGEVLDGFDFTLTRGATVTGIVTDPDGTPLAGATVVIAAPPKRGRFGMVQPPSGPSVMTDDEGRFTRSGLEVESDYRATVSHSRFLSESVEFTTTDDALDLGAVALGRGAVVRGVVTDAATGEPVAGAPVRLTTSVDGAGEMVLSMPAGLEFVGGESKFATTSDDGTFEIEPVASGEYEVRVAAPGYAPYSGERFSVRGTGAYDQVVTLGRGLSIAGSVFDAFDRPLSGAKIDVMRQHGGPHFHASAVSEADGRFQVAGLPEGSYSVKASYEPLSASTVKSVVPGGDPVLFTLTERGSVIGVATDLATGRPVEEFTVKLESKRAQELAEFALSSFGSGSKFRDLDGRFSVKDVDPGDYTLSITSDGFVRHTQDVSVKSGAVTEVEARLDVGGAVDGYVRDADGKPIAGVSIELDTEGEPAGQALVSIALVADEEGEEMQTFTLGGNRHNPRAVTDENGYYLLTGLPVGEVKLAVEHSEYIDRSLEGVRIVRAQTRRLEPMTLVMGGGVRGVIRLASGEPTTMAGVTIQRLDSEGQADGKPEFIAVDAEGRFEKLGVEAGSYRVEARRFGDEGEAARQPKTIEIRDGKTEELEFVFE